MPDEPNEAILTEEQRRAVESTVGAIQRIAMKLVELPTDDRQAQYAIVRRNFEASFAQVGMGGKAATRWLDGAMKALQALVSEIEASGSSSGGHA